MHNDDASKERIILAILAFLGFSIWLIALARINIADGDLWAKMALGSMLLHHGVFLTHDIFAFTPVLPVYVDHEWGSGVIFFGVLQLFGSSGLMLLKLTLASVALLAAAAVARRQQCSWAVLLFFVPFGAWALLPGYGGVLRSQAFTYAFYAVALLLLEELRLGRKWCAPVLVLATALWTNLHGGFVAGLGLISVYSLVGCCERKHWKLMLLTAAGCWLATLANPNGLGYWKVLVPALLHPRRSIGEWQSLPLFGSDVFVGFRILFLLALVCVVGAWRLRGKPSWAGLVMLALTAYLGWSSRRHAPFFALTAVAIATPYLQALLSPGRASAASATQPTSPLVRLAPLGVLYVGLALLAFGSWLPQASLQVLSPLGIYPVREVDVLQQAAAEGNVAVPFEHGSYVSWRLYPRVRVSMDGRYEAAYPESSFQMNQDFFHKSGDDWDRLIRQHRVDFIILDYKSGTLRPEDLIPKGYLLICEQPSGSALLALPAHAPALSLICSNLPPTTPDPLTAAIPTKWPKPVPPPPL